MNSKIIEKLICILILQNVSITQKKLAVFK